MMLAYGWLEGVGFDGGGISLTQLRKAVPPAQ
jgi:hypothetical protein